MSKFIKNRFSAFINGRCPRCQTGHIFQTSVLHKKFKNVNEFCPHCQVKFESEPGFFWGAMYFSYAVVVGMCIVLGIVFYSIYEQPPLFLTSGIIIGTILLLMPGILRLSRMLMIYVAAPYRKFDPTTQSKETL